jgi:hypothetical protein
MDGGWVGGWVDCDCGCGVMKCMDEWMNEWLAWHQIR